MDPTVIESHGGLEHQLTALYQERELLETTLGASSARQLIEMVESMSDQLAALYAERERFGCPSSSLDSQVASVAAALQSAIGQVDITVEGQADGAHWRVRCRSV